MKSWYLWVGLAVLVLLLLSVREGFLATATIKNPNTWNAAELTRIRGLVNKPEYSSDIKTAVTAMTDAELREVVGGFWSYSVPGRLPNEPATSKGWSAAETRIPTSDINEYLDGVIRLKPAYASKRPAFNALLTEYYIKQGESTFQAASTYSTTIPDTTPPRVPETPAAAPKTIERPTTATSSLRQEIATSFGIPLSSPSIDGIAMKVQSFYDTVYLPDKKTPTYTAMMGFADKIDTTSLPADVKNNYKVRLVEVLQTYFTPQTGVSETSSAAAATAGPASGESGLAGEAGGWAGTGKNIQGPDSGGRGTVDNTTGGLGIPRNYPVLYGGMQEYESAIPSSASLGTDPTSKFLPFSRVPGDMDLYPDPYRLGKNFSTSSYSSQPAVDPAPFLADFSKFFT